MPNVRWTLIAAAVSLAGCHSQRQQNADENLAAVPDNQVDPNATIEALPADESSATPSNQLQNGIDGPDVNDTVTNAE